MRVFIIPGTYSGSNVGDIAMLQIAVRRLQSLWTDVEISVFCVEPDKLPSYCPGTEPIGVEGRDDWYSRYNIVGPFHRFVPSFLADSLVAQEKHMRQEHPYLAASLIRMKRRLQRKSTDALDSFLNTVLGADLILMSGMGGIHDGSRRPFRFFNIFEMARKQGIPVALMGQGIGPIDDPPMLQRAREVLPLVNLIALREARAGLPLLRSLGVPEAKIYVTGDDAIELAYEARTETPGMSIGINARIHEASRLEKTELPRLREGMQQAGQLCAAPLLPVPILIAGENKDSEVIRELLRGYDEASDGGESLDSVQKVIQQVGRCRVVVTGSYHGAVFALSQGIPAICLARTPYYFDKFIGLAEQFGTGCEVLSLEDPALPETIANTARRLWKEAEGHRPVLLEAARRQIQASRTAYKGLLNCIPQYACVVSAPLSAARGK